MSVLPDQNSNTQVTSVDLVDSNLPSNDHPDQNNPGKIEQPPTATETNASDPTAQENNDSEGDVKQADITTNEDQNEQTLAVTPPNVQESPPNSPEETATPTTPTQIITSQQLDQNTENYQQIQQRSPRTSLASTPPGTTATIVMEADGKTTTTVTVLPRDKQSTVSNTSSVPKSTSVQGQGGLPGGHHAVSRVTSLNTSSKERDHKYIGKNHPEFELTYYMMVGMRTTVSRVESRPFQPVSPLDFKTATKQEFPKQGSSFTPALGKNASDFKFKDYCPEVFRHLRHFYKISPIEYITCVCGNYEFIEFISNSKSGQFFCYTHDFKFMIKTITKSESKFLRQILPAYYEHVVNNPDTLLSRFFGMHRVKSKKLKKTHFLLMGSVFYTDFPHEVNMTIYDLKGSTQGRSVSAEERAKPSGCVFKDNDFIDDGKKITLRHEHNERLRKQLECDVRFLQDLNIMDYSLLVGVLDLETCEQTVVPLYDEKGNPFSLYGLNEDGMTVPLSQSGTVEDAGITTAGVGVIPSDEVTSSSTKGAITTTAQQSSEPIQPTVEAVDSPKPSSLPPRRASGGGLGNTGTIDDSTLLSSTEHPTSTTLSIQPSHQITVSKQSPTLHPNETTTRPASSTISLDQPVCPDGSQPNFGDMIDMQSVPSNKRLSVNAPSDSTQTSQGKRTAPPASPTTGSGDARMSIVKRESTPAATQTRQTHMPTKYNQSSKPSDFALDFQPLPTTTTGQTGAHRLSLDDAQSHTSHGGASSHPPILQPSISMQILPTNTASGHPSTTSGMAGGPPPLTQQNAVLVNSDILHVDDEHMDVTQLNAVDQRARTRTIIEQKKVKEKKDKKDKDKTKLHPTLSDRQSMQMTSLETGNSLATTSTAAGIAGAPTTTTSRLTTTHDEIPVVGSNISQATRQSGGLSPHSARRVPDPSEMDTTTSVSVFTQDMGGVRGDGKERNKIYFLGIIDILTVYNWKKKGETWLKGLKYNKNEISSVNPERYATRFLEFMEQHTLVDASQAPES